MKIGDNVLALHPGGNPFYDGKVLQLTDDGKFAQVQENGAAFKSWFPVGQLVAIRSGETVSQAVQRVMQPPRRSWWCLLGGAK